MSASARWQPRRASASGDGAADAAAGAGDEGDAVAQLHGGAPAAPKRSTPSSTRPKRSASMSMK